MQLDCRNLECPEPVIRTKNALENLKDGDMLEILVNSVAPRENILRFLKSQNQNFTLTDLPDLQTAIKVVKNGEIKSINTVDFSCETFGANKKVIYLNEDRAGSGEVGEVLLSKFLGAFCQLDIKPYAVLLVNTAVKMSSERSHVSFRTLKDLESTGVKILSCGSCLQAYGLVDKLGVGEITNALEIADMLTKFDVIKL